MAVSLRLPAGQLKLAEQHWCSGEPHAAGTILFSGVINDERPEWAGRILNVACSRLPNIPIEITKLMSIVPDPTQWAVARAIFQEIRNLTLKCSCELTHPEQIPLFPSVLLLAENVAKVVFNATEAPAPYDQISGPTIVRWLRHIVDLEQDPEFEQEAWNACVQVTE